MSYSTIAIIYNPNSTGSGKTLAKELEDQILQELPNQKVELIETERAGHAEELAYSLAKSSQNPLIISSSGDGGYNELVNGAMKAQNEGYNPTVGLLPAGNANDHYHNIHDDDLLQKIVSNNYTEIDVLKMKITFEGTESERYGHSYIGFGLTPIVGNELNKTKLNSINEVIITARSFITMKPVSLVIDGKKHKYDNVIISNVDMMSKYFNISRPSSVTDGKFEVTVLRHRNKLKFIFHLLKSFIKEVEEDKQLDVFTLKTVDKTIAQIDGEIVSIDANTDVTISCENRKLRCVV